MGGWFGGGKWVADVMKPVADPGAEEAKKKAEGDAALAPAHSRSSTTFGGTRKQGGQGANNMGPYATMVKKTLLGE
jgi:hypothetical protein